LAAPALIPTLGEAVIMTVESSMAEIQLHAASAVSFQSVSKVFGGVRALDNVSFEVGLGEVHCLAGENGSGKSTLIKIIAGAYQPEPGAEMDYFGSREKLVTPVSARNHGIAVIWQDLALFGEMTVAENIAFETLVGNTPRLVNRSTIAQQAQDALAKLGVEIDLDARLNTLPIAQRQLVAIARTLVGHAKLIFMDEPTASLTQAETDRLLTIVRNLSAKGVAIVFVSHRLAEVLDVASRVTVLRDGKLVGVYPTKGMTQSRLTELMTGKTFDKHVAARDTAKNQSMLEVKGLSRRAEFDDVSLVVRRGEVLGLTGLIGAGRTELALTLFGRTKPDRGRITLDGKVLNLSSNRDAINAGISYVSEDRLALGLIQPQSIADNTVMAILPKLSNVTGLIAKQKKVDVVRKGLANLKVKFGKFEDPVSTLSGGNQQRVVLAKWLAANPKLLILDCPTVGVDVGARAGIYHIIRQLADEGLAILMISDEVSEVYFNADRILHMREGRIVGEYDPRTTTINSLEEAVYA
jgi:simple sugar transport system ATP-binding protein